MTPEQQRKMLKAAAKACGIDGRYVNAAQGIKYAKGPCGNYLQAYFNPLINPADCAEMCAKLCIHTLNLKFVIQCSQTKGPSARSIISDHNTSRLNAWMAAATMVSAKIGGYEE